ncbi:MAG: hypothetical protein ACE5JU_20385 [Candidatus Binatia bacterium]
MPRRKKKPIEWTTEEAMKHLFPKKVRKELHRIAHEKDENGDSGSSSQDKDNTEKA